ncbi:AAA family ATPase [Microbacterium invictum]|uniref:AAA family ATPase n=1 Tax=Microbacterium invictum TaxID=515415 RepID=A0ABZ0VCM0_9MICO|nr:AAA family ATPase [Microbacterium invictum]WQB70879.1 AAA family ATPase [Microbacterium invictum]
MPDVTFDTVLINGSVGTGKTTAAEKLGDELQRSGIPGAVIDVDWLRRSWPAPHGDPFRTALALENTRAIASNFRRAGALVLVIATVIESRDELHRNIAAASAENALHIRLTAAPDVVLARLTARHDDDEDALRWHARRHPELARTLDGAGFSDDVRIDTTARAATDIAQDILARLIGSDH